MYFQVHTTSYLAHTLDQRKEKMDTMMEEEYCFYWETLLIENQEPNLSMYGLEVDEVSMNQNNWSLPEGTPSSSVPRNIVLERRRRQLLNDKLKALRSAVPTITKFDKASIIKDAIDYIQLLQEQEKRMGEEMKELERVLVTDNYNEGEMPAVGDDDLNTVRVDDETVIISEGKKMRRAKSSVLASESPGNSSIEVMEIKVCHIGERTFAVSITCEKKRETTINVCELFESLNLKVIEASISTISRIFLHTLLVESEELNDTQLEELVKGGIAELNAERNPIVSMSF